MVDTPDRRVSGLALWWSRWPQWIGYVAAIWTLLYAALGLYWTFGGIGFPFGSANDQAAIESFFEGVQQGSGAPVIALSGLIAAVIAFIMVRTARKGVVGIALLTIAWLLAVALLVVIPDRRALITVAYALVFLLGAPFSWPPDRAFVIPWPVVNQFILMGGGVLWAMTALSYQRRMQKACVNCGRIAGVATWSKPETALRWGKWAVSIAIIVPAIYALTRWLWALGIPLGISEEFYREGLAEDLWLIGAALASIAVGGAILTLGLVQPWGERFPRWMIGLAGKRVPPLLAIIPASIVAVVVTSAGLADVRLFFILGNPAENWVTIGPAMLWPIWGVALAVATLSYYYRRRGACTYCGQE